MLPLLHSQDSGGTLAIATITLALLPFAASALQGTCLVSGCEQALVPASETPNPSDQDHSNIRAALEAAGPGGVVELCPGKRFDLKDQVNFRVGNVTLKTCTASGVTTRAILRVVDRNSNYRRATALRIRQPNVTIDYLEIDGGGPWPGRLEDGNNLLPDRRSELIDAGGSNGSNLTISNCVIREPMGWSALRTYPGASGGSPCTNALIRDNEFIDLGRPYFVGGVHIWADGISVGCSGTITRNTIINPSDGGIVVFQPNMTITWNTIEVNRNDRHSFGGINMVDCNSLGDMTNIEVGHNQFVARNGGNIDMAVAMGPTVWWCPSTGCTNYSWYNMSGSYLHHNHIDTYNGGSFKYGFTISRVYGLTSTGNDYGGVNFSGTPLSCSGIAPPPNRGAIIAKEDLVNNNLLEGVGFWDPSYPRSRFFHLIIN